MASESVGPSMVTVLPEVAVWEYFLADLPPKFHHFFAASTYAACTCRYYMPKLCSH